MKVVFFGTSNFSLPILETLNSHHEVVAVITTPDAPTGRRQELSESPVSSLARDLQLKTLKPESLKNNDLLRLELESLRPDLFVVAAYGKIIPQEIIALPPNLTLNVHPSLLPKYRGPSPIQYTLLNGDTETGVSLMQVDSEVDHGPLLTREKVLVDADDNFVTLSDKLARASAKLLLLALSDYVEGRLVPYEQEHGQAVYTKIITKQDGKIDWNKTSREIYNQFRAFYPWPGIWTAWNGKTLKIIDCIPSAYSIVEQEPGTVLAGGLVVCGGGTALEISRLQLEGKKEMGILDFLNGQPNLVGSKLG